MCSQPSLARLHDAVRTHGQPTRAVARRRRSNRRASFDEYLDMTDANRQGKTPRLAVSGMHCPNCEILIERKFGSISGVRRVSANYATGAADIAYAGDLDVRTPLAAVEDDGYGVSEWSGDAAPMRNGARDYAEIGAVFLILAAIVFAVRQLDLLPRGLSVSDNMSYGLVFLIGLVASVSSCIAVTGGLLVAVAAKYNEATGSRPALQRLKPLIVFNAGRVLSYTVLGGLIGALGSALTLSAGTNGILT